MTNCEYTYICIVLSPSSSLLEARKASDVLPSEVRRRKTRLEARRHQNKVRITVGSVINGLETMTGPSDADHALTNVLVWRHPLLPGSCVMLLC